MVRVPATLLISTMLSAGFALSAHAQSAPTAPPAMMAAPATATPAPGTTVEPQATADDQARDRRAVADRDAMFEAHLAALHAGLTLTPAQDALWPPVEQAIRGFVAMRATLHDSRSDRMQDRHEGDADEDPVAALTAYSDGLLSRAQALKALSSAAEPLYAALSDDQKHRLPMLLRDMAPRHGPVARMVDQIDHDEDRGPDDRMEGGPMRHHWEHGRRGEEDARHGWDESDAGDHPPHRDGRRADRGDFGGRPDWHHPGDRDGHRGPPEGGPDDEE